MRLMASMPAAKPEHKAAAALVVFTNAAIKVLFSRYCSCRNNSGDSEEIWQQIPESAVTDQPINAFKLPSINLYSWALHCEAPKVPT